MNNGITVDELLEMSTHYYATTKDIMKIGCIGEGKALRIKNHIVNLIGEPETIPRDKVPMDKVFEFFHINMDYIEKIINMREGINNGNR